MHRTVTITPHGRKARRLARRATRKGLRAQIITSGSRPHQPEFQTIVEERTTPPGLTFEDLLEQLGLDAACIIGDTADIRIDGWKR